MHKLRCATAASARRAAQAAPRLGRILVEHGAVTPGQLVIALQLQARRNARIGEILIAEGWTDAEAVRRALA